MANWLRGLIKKLSGENKKSHFHPRQKQTKTHPQLINHKPFKSEHQLEIFHICPYISLFFLDKTWGK